MTTSATLRAAVRALAPPPGRGRLGWLRRAALTAAMPTLVRRHHLGELLQALEAPRTPPPASASASDSATARFAASARRALGALRIHRTTCLYRSLAGFASRRKAGEPVQFLIGVRVEGGELLAHAWLERDGAALGEREEPRSRWAVAFVYPSTRNAAHAAEDPMQTGRASKDAILTELQDGTGVLLDLRSKFYFTLNRTGVALWKLLQGGEDASAGPLAEKIAAQFAAPSVDEVRRDVEAMLAELEKEGLVKRAGAGG